MNVTKKQLPKSQVELTIEAPAKDLDSYLDKAAEQISREIKIAGFRPGKAPRKIVQQSVGEFKLWQEAVNLALPHIYVKAILDNKIEAIGQPEIKLEKLAPNNPLVFEAIVSYLPTLTLPNYKKIKVAKKKIDIDEKRLGNALQELQRSRAKFAKVDRAAQPGDAVEINFKTFLNKVPVDQGESKNHPIVIGEGYFVPGFEEKITGMKAGDKKEFIIRFPKKYHQKELADRDVEFKVEMTNVQKRELPELNDKFAQSLGKFKDLADLKNNIKKNLELEAEEKEKSRLEVAIIEEIAEKTTADLPEVLIQAEVDKMLGELKDNVTISGGEFTKYLSSIKKTEGDLKKEFREKGEKRALFGLILREISKQEKIQVTDEEITKEIEHTVKHYQYDQEMVKKIHSEEYKRYAESLLVNRRVFKLLQDNCVKK